MYGGSSKVKGALTTPASVRRAVYGGGARYLFLGGRQPASDGGTRCLATYTDFVPPSYTRTYLHTDLHTTHTLPARCRLRNT